MINYIFSGIFIYFIFGLYLFIMQRNMIFNKSNKPEEYGLREVREIFIETSDHMTLLAWFYSPKKRKPLLIYFQGNSFDIGERAYIIRRYIHKGWGVLLVSWRGYSGNQGTPTEKNLYIDGYAALNWVKRNTDYQNSNIVLYGESLGSGVAVELGLQDTFKSIILEAPFKSIGNNRTKNISYLPC